MNDTDHTISQIYLFYDNHCSFCMSCVEWLSSQNQNVSLHPIPIYTEATKNDYPEVYKMAESANQMVAITDNGLTYVDDNAWIITLWALEDWRTWSQRLSRREMRPFVRRFWKLIAQNRYTLSKVMNLWKSKDLAWLSHPAEPNC